MSSPGEETRVQPMALEEDGAASGTSIGLGGPGRGPAVTQIDLWDIGAGANSGSTGISQPSAVIPTQFMLADQAQQQKTRRVFYLSAAFGLLVALGIILLAKPAAPDMEQGFGSDEGLWAWLVDKVETFLSGVPATPPPIVAQQVSTRAPPVDTGPVRLVQVVEGNPYWALPNRIAGQVVPLGRMWSADEEEGYRQALTSRYVYQRFKAVQDIRQGRLRGSEAILYDALAEKKFWTRMEAVIGLAEFGIPVDLSMVEKALGNARSSLVANYFRRFSVEASPGALYILRQAIRLVDERARLSALRSLAQHEDPFRELYLAAALQDPSRRVKQWTENELMMRPIDPRKMGYFSQVIQGYENFREDGAVQSLRAAQSVARGRAATAGATANGTSANYAREVEVESAPEPEAEKVEIYQQQGVKQPRLTPQLDDGFEELEAIEIIEEI